MRTVSTVPTSRTPVSTTTSTTIPMPRESGDFAANHAPPMATAASRRIHHEPAALAASPDEEDPGGGDRQPCSPMARRRPYRRESGECAVPRMPTPRSRLARSAPGYSHTRSKTMGATSPLRRPPAAPPMATTR